jgi:hypothetical protein
MIIERREPWYAYSGFFHVIKGAKTVGSPVYLPEEAARVNEKTGKNCR